MLFYLTILNLARFLTENGPTLDENKTDKQVVIVAEVWKHCGGSLEAFRFYMQKLCP